MYKEHLYHNLEREIVLLKQLAKTIEEKDLDFRPHEKSRSNIELMRYLSGLGANMLRWFIDNDLTPEEWLKIREHQKTLTIENFPARLDEQLVTIKRYMDAVTEEELLTKEITLPSKEKMMLGTAIMNAPIKWLATYRMQLFVNLKLNGHDTLTSKEAWSVMEA
jgi:hypothetical protein